jgi:zinc transport system permease protein
MWELLWPAWLAGCLIAFAAAPLGSLLVWRKLAYFGDSLSHATLLGVALSLWLHIPVWGGLVAVCVMLALILANLLGKRQLALRCGVNGGFYHLKCRFSGYWQNGRGSG